jgi:hypothetical protein
MTDTLTNYDAWLEGPYTDADRFDDDGWEPDPDRFHDDPDYYRPTEAAWRAAQIAYQAGLAEDQALREELGIEGGHW